MGTERMQVSKAVVIHGTCGHPDENWVPWLRRKLESVHVSTIMPTLPTRAHQQLDVWMEASDAQVGPVDAEMVIVGHSVGATLLLSILEHTSTPVSSAFFVSGFIGLLGDPRIDRLTRSFACREFEWESVRRGSRRRCVLASDNDPHVPLARGVGLAHRLQCKCTVVPKAGHFNSALG